MHSRASQRTELYLRSQAIINNAVRDSRLIRKFYRRHCAMSTTTARHNMVENQIRTNRITDERIIEAMDDIPRESYVPEIYKGVA